VPRLSTSAIRAPLLSDSGTSGQVPNEISFLSLVPVFEAPPFAAVGSDLDVEAIAIEESLRLFGGPN
jgi:hypothetical protein